MLGRFAVLVARWRRALRAASVAALASSTLSGCVLGLYDPPPPEGTPRVEDLESYLEEVVADSDPPSVSIAVSRGARVVYERAFGEADGPRDIAAGPNTTYRWFSVTKPFTALAVLQLAEAGALSVEAPAHDYLPYLRDLYGANSSEITIERLLSHRAGIGDIGDAIMTWVHVAGHHQQSELLRERLPAHAHFDRSALDFGHYSNLGYMILGAVVEAVSGESYEAYVTRHILEPLGMSRTRFYYEDSFAPETVHAVGSHPDDFVAFLASFRLDLGTLSRQCTRQRWWFEYFSPDQTPPSGLISTSTDMLKFGRMILNFGELDGRRVIGEASVRRMVRPIVAVASSPIGAPPDYSFGEAWFITHDAEGRRLLLHGGQGMAYLSLLMLRPDDGLVAALAANGTYVDGQNGLSIMQVLGAMKWAAP